MHSVEIDFLLGSVGSLVDPLQVPGSDVIPFGVDFVVASPEESGVKVLIECFQSTSSDGLHLGVVEVV